MNDKLSKMKDGHKRKENEFEQKMEETVQQLTKLRNASIFANEKFTRKNTEIEDLKTKLKAGKGELSCKTVHREYDKKA